MIEMNFGVKESIVTNFVTSFIILMEISSKPCALFMFNALIILIFSTSLKSKYFSLAWVKNIWFTGSTLQFRRGVHCSAKNLLKIFTFVWISVINLLSIKRRGIRRLFLSFEKVLRIDQYVLACNRGLFNFFARFC